jgi:hypothetical protein
VRVLRERKMADGNCLGIEWCYYLLSFTSDWTRFKFVRNDRFRRCSNWGHWLDDFGLTGAIMILGRPNAEGLEDECRELLGILRTKMIRAGCGIEDFSI